MSFTPYDSYRPSGTEWLGNIPEHWPTARIKTLFEIRKRIAGELGHEVLSVTQQGLKVRDIDSNDGQLSMDYSKYQLVEPDDFVMNHMDLLTGYVDLSRCHGVTSPDYRVFAARRKDLSLKYFLYIFQNGYRQRIFYAFGQGASGLGRWRMPTDSFHDFVLPLPPLTEQFAIAGFLDRETAKIDALMEQQTWLMKLLKEKRRAVIAHAVIDGLDPNVPMKDMGVDWLGDLPAHWELYRIKYLTRSIGQGWSPQCESSPVDSDEDWGVLKVGCVNGGIFKPNENKKLPIDLEPISELGLAADDLLVSRANTRELVGQAAVVPEAHPNLLLCDKLYRLRLEPSLCVPAFLARYLGTPQARGQIELAATGASSSMQNIGQSTILELPVALPPLEEQYAINTFLDQEITKIDLLTEEAAAAISLLQERRSALISAAVTGKVDVRKSLGADTPRPDVVAA
jgi:type I restriction enzyme, S subunit